jgi:hypothetical protein
MQKSTYSHPFSAAADRRGRDREQAEEELRCVEATGRSDGKVLPEALGASRAGRSRTER